MSSFINLNLLNFLDTALRVPPLFIIDEVLKLSCGFSPLMNSKLSQRYASLVYNEHPFLDDVLALEPLKRHNEGQQLSYQENYTDIYGEELNISKYSFIPTMGKVLFCFFALFVASVIFLLRWSKLLKVYTFLFSLMLIIFSYETNMVTIKVLASMDNSSHPAILQSMLSLNSTAIWDSGGKIFCIASNYFMQVGMGLLFTYSITHFQHSVVRCVIIISFLFPTFTQLLPLPPHFRSSVPVFSALLPLGILKYILIENMHYFFIHILVGYNYAKLVLHNYGLHSLLETEWTRLNVPNVLRTFWLLRTAQHITVLLGDYMEMRGEYACILNMDSHDAFIIIKEVLIYGCETSIALLGMTSVVSYIGHYVGVFFQSILMSEDDDERSMGTVCAILFFILAEQSGLTVLEGDKRFIRLCRNFTFLFTAMLHFTHNMVNPVLMSLSASRNPLTHRHVRALFVSLILILCPCLLIYILWNNFILSTWLLAVSAFSVQVVVKTFVSLLIYSLFLVDAYQDNFWESLDDYVYYIRAFGNSVEFIFGILLFFTGAWIYFFESGGSIRATMICIHAYFNIWCEAKNGWGVFMKRRLAVKKINSLPEATKEELDKHSDVCAICFQDLNSAKITKCNHFFHSVCLRKWLYVQDSCPLCHDILYKTEATAETAERTQNLTTANAENRESFNAEEAADAARSTTSHNDPSSTEGEDVRWNNEEIKVIFGEDLGKNDEIDEQGGKRKEDIMNVSPEKGRFTEMEKDEEEEEEEQSSFTSVDSNGGPPSESGEECGLRLRSTIATKES